MCGYFSDFSFLSFSSLSLSYFFAISFSSSFACLSLLSFVLHCDFGLQPRVVAYFLLLVLSLHSLYRVLHVMLEKDRM